MPIATNDAARALRFSALSALSALTALSDKGLRVLASGLSHGIKQRRSVARQERDHIEGTLLRLAVRIQRATQGRQLGHAVTLGLLDPGEEASFQPVDLVASGSERALEDD